jgi:dephospho-CoA kinase
VITGSMGAGKTTLLGEASDLLVARGIPHAAIDADALDTVRLPGPTGDPDVRFRQRGVRYQNLRAIWANSAAAGVERVLLAEAVEQRDELDALVEAVGARRVVVCRLHAALATMQARVRSREPGMLQERFVSRVAVLDGLLDQAKLEDFTIDNDGRKVTDVATDLLVRAGWLTR